TTRQVSARAARHASTTAHSAMHRNRRQLTPWALALPYGLLGTVAHLACHYGSVPPAAGLVLVLILGTIGSITIWCQRLRERTPERFRAKLHAGMGLGTLWAALMPITSSSTLAGPWLGLLTATVWLSLSWWRDHDHPIPTPRGATPVTSAPEPAASQPEPLPSQAARIRGIITAWNSKIADGRRAPVPGSSILHTASNGVVDCYRIDLDDTGPVTGEQISQHVVDIAFRLGVLSDRISFEVGDDPRVVWMRHQVDDPSYDYTGPV